MTGHCRLRVAVALAAAVSFSLATPADANRRVAVPELGSPAPVAVLDVSGRIRVEAKPRPSEGLLAFAERLCKNANRASAISRANGGVRRLKRGVRYRIPFELLADQGQRDVIRALLPKDQATSDGWRHRVARASRGNRPESLWSIALWFTGSGENHRALRQANGLRTSVIRPGQVIVVPRRLLARPWVDMLPAGDPAPRSAVAAAATAPTRSDPTPFVRYGSDENGEYAAYRLQAGEALYSSVVTRFTGRLFATDVNELVAQVKSRNQIANVRDLPIGYEVKIPLELLSARYLPPDDPRRQEWEAERAVSNQIENELLALDLDGVTVVLDAGHGGRDIGAPVGGLWESVYVYDIMLRTKRLLESRTAAKVLPTTREGKSFRIVDADVLPKSSGHVVLTEPPYRIDNAAVATNFRWYLSNSIYRRARAAGAQPGEVIFISIHADSLHPSLRGAMVYIPGLVGIRNNYGKTGQIYSLRREVRAEPRVSFTRTERTTSKGLSRDLAEHMLSSFRRSGLAIHHNVPIRDRIVRGRRVYVPAQLRFNRVPAKILLEVSNLGNEQDRRLMKTRAWRQQAAEAIFDGILSYFGVSRTDADRSVTAGS